MCDTRNGTLQITNLQFFNNIAWNSLFFFQGGANDVKNHRWFAEVNWQDVSERRISPPIVPCVNYPGDPGNFDEYDETNGMATKMSTPTKLC